MRASVDFPEVTHNRRRIKGGWRVPEHEVSPVTPGNYGALVRHEGFEPPTFWSVASVGSVLVAAVLAAMRERAAR